MCFFQVSEIQSPTALNTGLTVPVHQSEIAGPTTLTRMSRISVNTGSIRPLHTSLIHLPTESNTGRTTLFHSHVNAGAMTFCTKPTSALNTGLMTLFHAKEIADWMPFQAASMILRAVSLFWYSQTSAPTRRPMAAMISPMGLASIEAFQSFCAVVASLTARVMPPNHPWIDLMMVHAPNTAAPAAMAGISDSSAFLFSTTHSHRFCRVGTTLALM